MSWIDRAKAAKPQSLGEWILLAIALCLYPFVEFKNFLDRVTYNGRWSEGGIREFFGYISGAAAGVYVGYLTGWHLEWGYLSWLLLGLITMPFTKWYFFPIAYWLFIHPFWWAAQKTWKGIRYVAKHWLANILNGILGALRCLPGSNALWTSVLDDAKSEDPEHPHYPEESWVQKLLYVITVPTAAISCCLLGYHTYQFVFGLFSLPLLNWGLGVGAGLFVGLFAAGTLWNWFEHGKVPALAVTAGGIATYFGAGYIADAVSLLGLTGSVSLLGWTANLWVFAGYALAMILWTAYIYPAADWFLRNGIEWCWKKLKPAFRETYDEKDKDYAGFFHHLTNIVVSTIVFFLSLGLCGDLGLAAWASYALAAVAAALTYEAVFKLLDDGIGNGLTGLALSGYAGWQVGNWWHGDHTGWMAGDYATIGIGVTAAAITGFILFPVVYSLLRGGLRYVGLHIPLRDFFAWVYGGIDKGFRWVGKKLEVIYTWSYRDKHAYAEFFLHSVGIAITYIAFTYLVSWTSAWWALFSWPVVGLATIITYIAAGKTLTKSGYGIEFVGGVASLAAAVFVGAHVHSLYHLWYVTGIVGVAAGALTFAIGFPAVYWIVKGPGWVLSKVLGWLVVGGFNFLWGKVEFIANKFAAVYQWLVEALAPYFGAIAGWIQKIRDMYAKIRKSIFGGQ